MDLWTGDLGSSLAFGQKLPLVSSHMKLSNMAVSSSKPASWEGRRECLTRSISQAFVIWPPKWHTITLAIILFIRSKSLGPVYTQGDGITQGYEYQEMDLIRSHVRSCLPQLSCVQYQKFSLRNIILGFPGGAVVKNPPANAGDMGRSPGPGRSHMPRSN